MKYTSKFCNFLTFAGVFVFVLSGSNAYSLELPVGHTAARDGVVVHSRTSITISANTNSKLISAESAESAVSSNGISIVVNNAPSTMSTLDTSLFIVPQITSDLLTFGSLRIQSLKDNNLKVCGPNANEKCTTALIRLYTTGTAGPGLWNDADGYGAPIMVGQDPAMMGEVGLGSENAIIVQTASIPGTKNVLTTLDFPNAQYQVDVDFSNAGAGSYGTTLVVEYALAP
jgi:hypothetical protein